MPDAGLVFAYPLENLLRTAQSITVTTGTEESGYEVAHLFDGSLAHPARFTGTSATIVGQWASPVLPQWPILFNTNLTVAAILEGHSDLTFGAGTPNVSVTFGIPTLDKHGFYSAVDLDLSSGYSVQLCWRLRIVSNGANVSLGEVWLTSARRVLSSSYLFENFRPGFEGGTVVLPTTQGPDLRYPHITIEALIDGGVIVDEDEFNTIEDWIARAQFRGRMFPLKPSGWSETVWMVHFETDRFSPELLHTGSPAEYRIALPVRHVNMGEPTVDPDTL